MLSVGGAKMGYVDLVCYALKGSRGVRGGGNRLVITASQADLACSRAVSGSITSGGGSGEVLAMHGFLRLVKYWPTGLLRSTFGTPVH